MVRLNEPAAPLESLELLRKRFLRQNKEIIKINADQAAKIRGLEAETSRLLSENITLREENIRLSHDLKKGRHALALENVGNVKDKLQIFASGLTDLITELTEAQSVLPNPTPYHTPKRRSPKTASREWRGGLNIADLAEQEGRLPPIVEGKYYPRKTLDAEEIGSMMQTSPMRPSPARFTPGRPSPNLSESPDLGLPPVIQFDMGDPVKHIPAPASPSPVKLRAPPAKPAVQDQDTRQLSMNLETRKKRRTSSFVGDWDKSALKSDEKDTRQHTDSQDVGPADGNIKAGGKRKFSIPQNDENAQNAREQISRVKAGKNHDKPLDLPIREGKPSNKVTDESDGNRIGRSGRNSQGGRRALGEKPVNTDPTVSPAKSKSRQHREHKKNDGAPKLNVNEDKSFKAAQHATRPDQSSYHEIQDAKTSEQKQRRKPAQIETIQYVEPETPAPAVDIISPTLSVPSLAAESASHDTPPPGELGGRPSRRSRPAVSYAEPNLRDKMRRPTKELVDAVGSDSKSSRLSSNFVVRASDEKPETTIDIPQWKDNMQTPASPLASKYEHRAESSFVSPASGTNKRRTSTAVQEMSDGAGHAQAESKVEQIVSNSTRRISRAREAAIAKLRAEVESIANADSHAREQDIFDMASSSPEAAKASGRAARRMSSVPENMNRFNGQSGESRRKGGRRRETLANEASVADTEAEDSQLEANGATTAAASRNERIATRRRSMML